MQGSTGFFSVPHYPKGNYQNTATACECRKPKTGLIKMACGDFDIDMANSYVIGDRCTDMELARNADLKGILVKTGYGLGDLEYVFPHLSLNLFIPRMISSMRPSGLLKEFGN